MSNPYRARPGRPRVDHTQVSSFGVQPQQNKNVWPQMSAGGQPPMPTNVFQPQQQTPVANQPQKAGDPWDWGSDGNVDNGNDAWNWSIDQTHEAQQQQQQQQQQYVPTYPNMAGQTGVQDNYYNNSNGNRTVPPQPMIPPAAHPPRSLSREATPSLPPQDSYSNYPTYGNQQRLPPAPMPNVLPPASASVLNANNTNQPQWSAPVNQQQPMHVPTNFDIANQNTPYHQHQQLKQPPQQHQESWQNHAMSNSAQNSTPYWQNSNDDVGFNSMNNQWAQLNKQPENSQYNNHQLTKESEETKRPVSIPPPSVTPQWQDDNQRKQTVTSQPPPLHNIPLNESSWQAPTKESAPKVQEQPEAHKLSDWHTEAPPIHFNPPSIPNSLGAPEAPPKMERPPSFTSIPTPSATPDAPKIERPPSFPPTAVSPDSLPMKNETRSNTGVDRSAVADLSTSINQMSLENVQHLKQQPETQLPPRQEIPPPNQRSSQPSVQPMFPEINKTASSPQQEQNIPQNPIPQQSGFGAVSHQETPLTFNSPVHHEPPPSYTNFKQSQPFSANNPLPPQNPISAPPQAHEMTPPPSQKPPEPIPQHYDQWYNQNAPQISQLPPASQNNWYPNLESSQAPLQKHWTPPPATTPSEPLLETSENNQPPAEFNSEPVPEETPRAFELEVTPIQPSTNFQGPPQVEQEQPQPENYEFASNDRNTFLETGELTDSHHEQESTAPSQDEDNDEVPNDIPFLREVPGQSEPIRSNVTERRDVPPGQERRESGSSSRDSVRTEPDPMERRNDPSGRERSLPPAQPRNDPSGEERISQSNSTTDADLTIDSETRQIPGGVSPNESTSIQADDRVVTGSQEYSSLPPAVGNTIQETREEAVGASTRERESTLAQAGSPKRRDSYEDGDDEESPNSRDASRERPRERRDQSPPIIDSRRRYDRGYYDHDRDREYDDDYYYDRRRDYDRPYNSREDLDRRDGSYRERHREEEDPRRAVRGVEERTGGKRDERRVPRDRTDDPRRRDREPRDYGYGRDGRPRRRYDDYDRDHRREYFDDPYARSSRPSSRSSYNDRERDYYRPRDAYYGYNGYGGYDYGPNYNANYYAYLENLRRTNPTAYMEWYNKYYASHAHHQQQQPPMARTVPSYPEDRASVHSGQSSCDDSSRITGSRHLGADLSLIEDSRIVSRMTPTKFSTSHVQGVFSIGSLIHVHASYPADGDRARVDIIGIDSLLLQDPIARELRSYPGPLIKGVTHKKTIIEYCENKIKKATTIERTPDRASYVLLYQLMIMLIQQNGNVVGVDIATLLLRNKEAYPYENNDVSKEFNRQSSNMSQRSADGSSEEAPVEIVEKPEQPPRKTIEEITNEFRNTLLYGLVQEALEFAMNEGLWGHALFLASKLDKRTHASVMTRFANSLQAQDPLQTLYQLHSGRVPASVTCVADPKWDDWRPHLAMIISNTSTNPEINRRAITTMGDTLATRGDIYAAHFCYILAEIDFGSYGKSGIKMVLIGSNHNKHYEEFVTLEAIMLTEIYEYARSLSEPSFMLTPLQTFKFENALKMIDCGLMEKGLLYLEQIAVNIVNSPSKFKPSFIHDVYKLSERIKFHDPIFKESTEDETSLPWLNNLTDIVGKYQTGEIITDVFQSREMLAESQEVQHVQQQQQQPEMQQSQWGYQTTHQDYPEGSVSMMEVPTVETTQDQWQHMNPQSLPYQSNDPNQYQYNQTQSLPPQPQQDYWGQQAYSQPEYNDWQHQQTAQQNYQQEQSEVDTVQQQQQQQQQQNTWNYEPQPQISMGPSSGKQYDPLEELDAMEQPAGGQQKQKSSETNKSVEKSSDKKPASSSGGSWFGGLFSKLAPKPKNQMILPDDNNPTIVWDPNLKKWVNKDEGDGEGGSSGPPPPPKAAEMSFKPSQPESPKPPAVPQQTINAPAMSIPSLNVPANTEEASSPNSSKMLSGNNMFKLQKSRGMRANYIDVMNPNATKANVTTVPTPAGSPMMPMASSSPQLFIPAPVNDPNAPLNFLTPAPIPSAENPSQGTDNENAVAK